MLIRLLGPVSIVDGGAVAAAGKPQQCLVLAVLAAEAGRPVPVEVIMERVWDAAPPAHARRTLHTHITRIRRLLEDSDRRTVLPVIHRAGSYLLDAEPSQVDFHRFAALVEAARDPMCQGHTRAALLRDALALWHGEPLAGLAGLWADRTREAWTQQRLEAVMAWARAEIELGNADATLGTLTELVAEHPLVEGLTAALMRALYATGRTAQALRCYASLRRRLAEELGADPGAELQAVHLTVLRGGDASGKTVVPAQLPRDVPGFCGRDGELARLDELLDEAARHPGTVVLSGMAGVGKTSLAVHWAHRVAHRFPGGQLYVNLRGFDSDGFALTPHEVLRGFLDSLGVPARRVPAAEHSQIGLYRSLIRDRRMLIVLDNARDSGQVRDLLPATPGCLALITSRNQLPDLVVTEAARFIQLEPLPAGDCRPLLAHRLGSVRIDAEPHAVDDIIALCARLPLALSVVAARAIVRPTGTLQQVAEELRAGGSLLDGFAATGTTIDPRTVFSWSLRGLDPAAARLFRLLSAATGPDFGTRAAASIAGLPVSVATPLLDELVRTNLLAQPQPGRYAFHDLLHAYAGELAGQDGEDTERALLRLLDHYLHTSNAIAGLMYQGRTPFTLPEPGPGVVVEPPPDQAQAVEWFDAERHCLIGAVRTAAAKGLHDHAWKLAWALKKFFEYRGHWYDDIAVQLTGLESARRLGDPDAQARCRRSLGAAYARVGDYGRAQTHLRHALRLCRSVGDHTSAAHTRLHLALMLERQDRHGVALAHAERALDGYERAGHNAGQARALSSIAWYQVKAGRHQAALVTAGRALHLLRATADEHGQSSAWDTMGYAHHHLGEHDRAIECYLRALELVRETGDRYHEAKVLDHLGDTHDAAGDRAAARQAWVRAVAILDELHHSEAEGIRAKLQPPVPAAPGRLP